MKPEEKQIIEHLRKGKKVNISEIARELNLPISTVADRIKRIEDKYILKRSSLLDHTRMGYLANVMLAIKVNQEQKKSFLSFLKEQNCVNSIYHINSGFNFLVEIIFKDQLGLIKWVEEIKSTFPLELMSFQLLKTEEKEKFIPS